MDNMPKILLIDDDEDFTQAMQVFFSGHNMQVWVADNGQDGLALAKKVNPDLILLDVMMNYLNEGFVVAGQIKKDAHLAKIPIIFVTGFEEHINDDNVDHFSIVLSQWHAASIIHKPIEPTKLLEQINKILNK